MYFKCSGGLLCNTCCYKFCKIHRKHWTLKCQTFILTKLQRFNLQCYQKRDSDTDVFLWIFQSFSENLLYRTPPGDCLRVSFVSFVSCLLYLFLKILVEKVFWMILQYFRKVVGNLVCKSFGCRNRNQHIVN